MRDLRLRLIAVRVGRPGRSRDAGAAAVEFASIGVLLMIPLMYLIMTMGRIQAGSLAAQAGARSAVRAMTTAESGEQGNARAHTAAAVALADQGFDRADGTLSLDCSAQPCLTPGAQVRAQVDVQVDLPLVPSFLSAVIPLSVTVTASGLAVVDDFRAAAW